MAEQLVLSKENNMLWIDLKNAIEDPDTNNFTCLLLRLMLKSDTTNMAKLGSAYPEEAKIVWLFKNDCSYKDENKTQVDYELLEVRACQNKEPYATW